MKTYTLEELIELKVAPIKVSSSNLYRVREVVISGKKKFYARKIHRLAFVIQQVMVLLERENKMKEVARQAAQGYMEWEIEPSPKNTDYAWQAWIKLSRSEPLKEFISISSCAYYQPIFESAFIKEVKRLCHAQRVDKDKTTTS